MSEPFVAEIRIFAGFFAPRGWALCNGQLLPISQNTALFSLIGTTYGGDGRTTTALPNLKGRAPMHPGSGPGLTTRRLGQRGGQARPPAGMHGRPSPEVRQCGGGPPITPVSGADQRKQRRVLTDGQKLAVAESPASRGEVTGENSNLGHKWFRHGFLPRSLTGISRKARL